MIHGYNTIPALLRGLYGFQLKIKKGLFLVSLSLCGHSRAATPHSDSTFHIRMKSNGTPCSYHNYGQIGRHLQGE